MQDELYHPSNDFATCQSLLFIQHKKMIVAIGSTANKVKTAQHNLLIDIEGPLSSYHASQVCLQLILPLCLRDDFLLQWDVQSNAV